MSVIGHSAGDIELAIQIAQKYLHELRERQKTEPNHEGIPISIAYWESVIAGAVARRMEG